MQEQMHRDKLKCAKACACKLSLSPAPLNASTHHPHAHTHLLLHSLVWETEDGRVSKAEREEERGSCNHPEIP